MTTFQLVTYAIVYGLTLFLPVGNDAHDWAISKFLGWSLPDTTIYAAMAFGGFLAAFLYFVHDWVSLLFSGLRVVIFWKKPMTVDERMIFFVLIACLPPFLVWYFVRPGLNASELTPLWVPAALAFFCLPLWIAARMNRKTKMMLNWNWLDGLIVGITQCISFLPGAGRQTGALIGALFRNYNLEAAAKFSVITFCPVLGAKAIYLHQIAASSQETTHSSFQLGMVVIITLGAGLLSIGGLMRSFQPRQYGHATRPYLLYRILLATALIAIYLLGI